MGILPHCWICSNNGAFPSPKVDFKSASFFDRKIRILTGAKIVILTDAQTPVKKKGQLNVFDLTMGGRLTKSLSFCQKNGTF